MRLHCNIKALSLSFLTQVSTENLLRNPIATTYKKANKNIGTKINKEGYKFAKQTDTLNEIEMNGTDNSFVNLKDHKESVLSHLTTRHINLFENEIEKTSKYILD